MEKKKRPFYFRMALLTVLHSIINKKNDYLKLF